MKRWIKALLFLLAGVLVLIVATVVAAVLLFDGERIRSVLVETVAEKTGRTLTIAEVPELTFWPRIGVRLGAVTLSEKLSAEESAGIDGASLSVSVMPLFRGELVADSVAVSGLRARLVRNEGGELNVSDLMGPASSSAPTSEQQVRESAAARQSPPIRFDVGGIHVDGRELSWDDRQAGQAIALRDFSISSGRLGPGAEGQIELAATVQMAGATSAKDELRIRLVAPYRMGEKSVELRNLDGELNGSVTGVRQLRLTIAAAGVSVAADGRSGQANGLRLAFDGELSDMTTKATFDASQLTWSGDPEVGVLASPKASLSAQASRGAGWKADAALAGLLELRAAADATRLKLQDWQGTSSFLDDTLLQKPLVVQSQLSADLDLRDPRGDVDLQFALADSRSRIKATLNALSPLDVIVNAQLGKLDLDTYLLAPPPAASSPAPHEGKPAGDPAIDLSVLNGKRIRARVESAGLKARGIVVDRALVEGKLANGRLELSPLQVALYGGSLGGSLGVASNGNAVSTRLKLAGVDLNPMLRDLAATDLIAGRADVVADLASRGATVGAMKRALVGDLQLVVRDGALKGVNLARSFRDLKAKFSQGGASDVATATDAQTDFSELTASFQVRDGVLRGDDLSAKSPFLRLGGAGEVSLPDESLDYLLKATVVNTSTGQGGDDLAHLKGVTVPVRLRGPVAAPAWKIEFGGLAGEAAKARLAEKKEAAKAQIESNKDELREQVREKARDKLKSLLGR